MNHASGDKQQLLEDWFEEYGTEPVTVGDGLINIATVGDDMSKFPELPFTNYDGRINRTKFGRYLARMKYWTFLIDGHQYSLAIAGADRNNRHRYQLRPVGDRGVVVDLRGCDNT